MSRFWLMTTLMLALPGCVPTGSGDSGEADRPDGAMTDGAVTDGAPPDAAAATDGGRSDGGARSDGSPGDAAPADGALTDAGALDSGSPGDASSARDMAPQGPSERCNGLDDDEDDAIDEGGVCPLPPLVEIAAAGASITLEGALTPESPQWERFDPLCEARADDAFFYDAHRIINRTGAPRTVEILGRWGEVDGFLHVFDADFAPVGGRCLAGSDDGESIRDSRIAAQPIAAGETLTVVVSTYAADTPLPGYTVEVRTRDPECVDGDEERDPCGIRGNGTRVRTCVDERWSAFGACDDPDRVCADGEVEASPCGLNDRGTRARTCEEGRFGPLGPCDDPDECPDGAVDARACGINDRGERSRACAAGRWSEFGGCVDPDVCIDGAEQERVCGLNDRGTQARGCDRGAWGEWRPCADPDTCVDGAIDERACGPNGGGIEQRVCARGDWGRFGLCEGGGQCVNGEREARVCGLNDRGEATRACVDGAWPAFGPCDDDDVCQDAATESRACGLNNRGQASRRCVRGQWDPWGACDDPDACVDEAVERQACVEGGNRNRVCFEGAWQPFDPCVLDRYVVPEDWHPVRIQGRLGPGDATWSAPSLDCEARERPGYWVDSFTVVKGGGWQDLAVMVDFGDTPGRVHVYRGPFDPDRPVENCEHAAAGSFDDVYFNQIRDIAAFPGDEFQVVVSNVAPGSRVENYTVEIIGGHAGRRPQPGDLAITEIMYNPSAVPDRDGEWFEVVNLSDKHLQLGGTVVSDADGNTSIIEDDVTVWVVGRAVIGSWYEEAVNGGVEVDTIFTGFQLDNGGDAVVLSTLDDEEIDRVAYDPGGGWPDDPGRSIQLDRDADPALNGGLFGWCSSGARLPSGDFGTPGEQNGRCN